MRAYEVPVEVTSEGKLEIPESLLSQLTRGEVVRLIVLINDPGDQGEDASWSQLTLEQFLSGYSESDAIYDTID